MTDYAEIRKRASRAKASMLPAQFRDVSRRALTAWIEAAEAHALPAREALRRLRDGEAALQAGDAALQGQLADPTGPMSRADCTSGCAFCCILTGADGGTISRTEATRLHAALAPLAGQPDGRMWHPSACPALDPESRMCRAYDARPAICRSYISPDVTACERIAQGENAPGPGVLGGYILGLSTLLLTREALRGVTAVPTYSLAKIAAAAVEGQTVEKALEAAKHPPRELTDEIARHRTTLS